METTFEQLAIGDEFTRPDTAQPFRCYVKLGEFDYREAFGAMLRYEIMGDDRSRMAQEMRVKA